MILSREDARRVAFQIDEYQREKTKLAIEHEVISKYHRQQWYQESVFQTEGELVARMRVIAETLESIEVSIDELRCLLHRDNEERMAIRAGTRAIEQGEYKLLEQQSLF